MTDAFDRLKTALADRYAIERELGTGGMATVYLAEDLKHHRKVAVKVLKPDLAAALGPERFLQEIEIAANLQHPHILPLYDSGDAGGFLYYVMPYVKGESLRDRLSKEGELPVADAVRILKEIVDALAKAHSEGVVHRDIKPDNVMLSDRHALVTDFGVAKAVSEATGRQKLTTEGIALGTPAYMSPEQAAADPLIDHRTDIYAVGAVAYELLTGRPPFTGTTQQEILAAHVTQAAEPVTKYREAVSPALAELVMKCLEKKPADRWQSAVEMLPHVEVLATPSGGMTPTGTMPTTAGKLAGKRPARQWIVGLVGAAAVVAIAAVLLRGTFYGGGPGATAASGAEETRRLVVAPLEDRTGDPRAADWGLMAAEFVTRGIDRASVVDVVPASSVRDLLRELPDGGLTGTEIAERTEAGYLVAGSYSTSGDQIRFDVELVNVESEEMMRALDPVSGAIDSLEIVIGVLAERVTGAVVGLLDPEAGAFLARSTPPPSMEVFRGYVATQDLFCRGRWQNAIDRADQALRLAPDYAPLLSLVRTAFSNQGRYVEADSVRALIEPLHDQLTREERAGEDWMEGNIHGNPALSTRGAEELYRISPTTYGYPSGATAYRNNRLSDALERFLSHDIDAPCSRDWTAWWSSTASVYHLLGRHDEELALARRGLERFPNHMRILDAELHALVGLGQLAAVDSLLDVIAGLPSQEGYSPGLRPMWAALELKAHGYHDAYELTMDRAVAWHVAQPTHEQRYNRGRTFYYAERWVDADTLFAALIAESPENVSYRGFRGATLARLGRREAAMDVDRWFEDLDRSFLRGSNTAWRARIAAILGDRDRAIMLLQQAFREGYYYSIALHREPAFESLRDYSPFVELMRPKG